MKLRLFAVLGLTVLLVSPASAAIVGGSVTGGDALAGGGIFKQLTVPFIDSAPDNTIGNNNLQEMHLYGLDEQQNVTLTSNLAVDILADGSGGGSGPGDILSGIAIASYYIFFDPLGGNKTQQGTVTFDAAIFGIITGNANLLSSDFLQAGGVTYLNSSMRGLESGDTVTITSLQSIAVDWKAGTPGDYIRVITAVPVPAAVWLFGTGLLGLLGVSRFRKSTDKAKTTTLATV